MRVGLNPMNEEKLAEKHFAHRIVMPVYIPNAEGYFEDSFEVLKLSIDSLLKTINSVTAVTIINNACTSEVTSYLRELLAEKSIDQLIENAINKGKVDPVASILKGALEPLITITDADVLFKVGWQEEVEKIFFAIPNVGMVSPLPLPARYRYYSKWSLYFGFTRNCFFLKKNFDVDSVQKFRESVNRFNGFSDIEKQPLGLRYNNVEAIMGSSHFCATYNKAIAKWIPNASSGNKFNGAEVLFLDKPVENAGLMRLATNKGWVYHIGNKVEPWMYELQEANKLSPTSKNVQTADYHFNNKGFLYKPKFINNVIGRIIDSVKFKNLIFAIAKK